MMWIKFELPINFLSNVLKRALSIQIVMLVRENGNVHFVLLYTLGFTFGVCH